MVNFPVDFHPSFECPLQRRNNLTFITNISIYVIKQARFRWKQSVGVVFIFSSKTRVLVWCGLKQAENRLKTSYVSDLRLSLGENARFQKWAFSACFQAENDPFINSGTGFLSWSLSLNYCQTASRYKNPYRLLIDINLQLTMCAPVPEFIYRSFSAWKQAKYARFWKR